MQRNEGKDSVLEKLLQCSKQDFSVFSTVFSETCGHLTCYAVKLLPNGLASVDFYSQRNFGESRVYEWLVVLGGMVGRPLTAVSQCGAHREH